MNPGYLMTLDDLKTWNKDLVNIVRTEKMNKGYIDQNGIVWASTPTDIANLNGVLTLIALGVVSSSQTWRDYNNINHEMTPTQLIMLAGGLALFIKQCYVTSWTHKYYIDVFQDTQVQDLLDYDIMTGWPK
jgi:hypothetical protein